MSPAATGRARKPRDDVTSASAAIASRDAADLRKTLRDRVCVGPTHPGRPDQYRVSVSTKCVATSGEAKEKAKSRTKEKRQARPAPTVTQTRSEIKAIENEIARRYAEPADLHDAPATSGSAVDTSFMVLLHMIDPKRRLETPDPLLRFEEELAEVKRISGIKTHHRSIQRYMVLRATLLHLVTNLKAAGALSKGSKK